MRDSRQKLVFGMVGGFGLGARLLLADEQLQTLFFGALAFEDFSMESGVGARQLGGALLDAQFQLVVLLFDLAVQIDDLFVGLIQLLVLLPQQLGLALDLFGLFI